jgi:hypothetical protein
MAYQSTGRVKYYVLWDGTNAYNQPTHEGDGHSIISIPLATFANPATFNVSGMKGLPGNPGVADAASAVLLQNTPEADDPRGTAATNAQIYVDTSNPAPAGGLATYGNGALPAYSDFIGAGNVTGISCLEPYINVAPVSGDTAKTLVILAVDHLRRWQS